MTQKMHQDRIAEIEKEIAENEEKLRQATLRVHEVALKEARRVLANFALSAPIDASMSREESRDALLGHLIGASAIPLHPNMSEFLSNGGFDSSNINKDPAQEYPTTTGAALLKFAGFLSGDAPTIDETELLISLNENSTKH